MDLTHVLKNRSSALHRLVAILGAVALCLGLAALTPPGAQAAGGRGKPGTPETPAAAPPPAASCTLTDPEQPDNEFAACTIADVDLLSTPGVGETATARITVTSQEAVSNADVSLAVNDNFSVVSAPGFANAGETQSGVGPVSTLSQSADLAAGGTRTFDFTVRALSKGYGVIQARVKTGRAKTTAGGETALQIGGPAAPTATGGLAVVAAPEGVAQAPASSPAPYRAAPVGGPGSLAPSAPNASCAIGRWVFNNELGQQTSSMNYQVQAWDQDSSGGDDLLAVAVTNGSGSYNLCFESTDTDQGGGQEVYIKFISSNNAWRVRDTAAANNNYVFSTGVQAIADPGTANFGTLQPADGALHRALHAFDGINLLWLWQSSVSGCLDNPGQCRQMVVNWTPSSTDGTYYSTGSKDVHLAAANPDADHITIHEGGHALMDAIYNDAFPAAPNCNPHSIFGNSSTGCAWTEGWAEWVPARVLEDPFFRWDNGAALNLETPTWNDGNPHGDANEGRIAGTLIDLSDNNNEAPWDRYGESESYGAQSEEIYSTNLIDVSGTLSEYFNTDRPGEGSTGYLARTAVFANTISYAANPQRDPLVNGGQLTRPSLSVTPSPHNYSYSTPSGYWSGVAIRGGNDNDLTVYDDEGQTASLATSNFAGNTIDYVLVDSNSGRRPIGDSYFPQAYLFAGSGAYDVELSTNSNSIGVGVTNTAFATGDVIDVRDAFMSSGVLEFIRVVPGAGLNVDVNLHVSTATASTWVQGRPSAAAGSSGGGAGVPESFSYTPVATGWAGLALVNNGGSGTATIYRDTSAPSSSSVVIDGGAATTADQQVDLSLSSTDAQTGIQDMRISVDGVFDTEAFEPYVASKSVTLPAGDGTKTVDVQFRNNAGMVSTAGDTIVLDTSTVPGAPTVTSTTPSAGAISVAFTPGSNGGSPITSYTAQCISTDGGTNNYKVGATSPLNVTGLTAGKHYHCRVKATNAVGVGPFGTYGATVLVPATVPGAPTVTSTTPSAGAISVAFTPGSNGGSPITSYTAQCISTDGGTNNYKVGATSPLNVTGLTAGKHYHCRVKATNAVGVGPFGTYGATVLVPATVPGAPTVTSTTPSAGAISVAFTPGSNGGSPITSYTAQCISTDGGTNNYKVGATSPLNVTGLTAGKHYHCRVKATNAVGVGPFGTYGATVLVP